MKTIQSIDKAIRILEAIAQNRQGTTLTELGRKLEIPLPTLHGFIASLEKWNLIFRVPENGRYFPGSKILQLASYCDPERTLIGLAHPYLTQLSEKYEETVHMAIPISDGILYVDKVECRRPFRMTSMVGMREKYENSAIGLVLAKNLNISKIQRIQNSIEDNSVSQVDANGKTASLYHRDMGIHCLAVALFQQSGQILGGISIAIPERRFTPELQELVFQDLLEVAESVRKRY